MGSNAFIIHRTAAPGQDLFTKRFLYPFVLGSRLYVGALAIFTSLILYHYDTSADLFLPHLNFLLKPFVRWDSLFFLDIAKNGYRFEQQHAFFPGYPFLIWIVSRFLGPLSFIVTAETVLVLSALLITNLSFFYCAKLLYK